MVIRWRSELASLLVIYLSENHGLLPTICCKLSAPELLTLSSISVMFMQ